MKEKKRGSEDREEEKVVNSKRTNATGRQEKRGRGRGQGRRQGHEGR